MGLPHALPTAPRRPHCDPRRAPPGRSPRGRGAAGGAVSARAERRPRTRLRSVTPRPHLARRLAAVDGAPHRADRRAATPARDRRTNLAGPAPQRAVVGVAAQRRSALCRAGAGRWNAVLLALAAPDIAKLLRRAEMPAVAGAPPDPLCAPAGSPDRRRRLGFAGRGAMPSPARVAAVKQGRELFAGQPRAASVPSNCCWHAQFKNQKPTPAPYHSGLTTSRQARPSMPRPRQIEVIARWHTRSPSTAPT
jgi:hypothetical protein